MKDPLGASPAIVGQNAKLIQAVQAARKAAACNASVIITGESGTGKELIAQLIHFESSRKDQPLIKLNCAALPEHLIENELFGSEKGSFTGAYRTSAGKFELAHNGTLFLDEIGDMPFVLQSKLLRVLEDGCFFRIGGEKQIHSNTRIITATNKNIFDKTINGTFRQDLYYRLHVIAIDLPALRTCPEDIPALANFYFTAYQQQLNIKDLTLSKSALEKMQQYFWPGNVRELKNTIERAIVMRSGPVVDADDVCFASHQASKADPFPAIPTGTPYEEAVDIFRKSFIMQNLDHTNWNRTKTAQIMQVQRTYLSKLIGKFDLKNKNQPDVQAQRLPLSP